MRSSVKKQPGESIVIVTLESSLTAPDSQPEFYELSHQLSRALRQCSGEATCIVDATRVDTGSAQRILRLIDTLGRGNPARSIQCMLVIDKYPSGPMRSRLPVYSTTSAAFAAARSGIARPAA